MGKVTEELFSKKRPLTRAERVFEHNKRKLESFKNFGYKEGEVEEMFGELPKEMIHAIKGINRELENKINHGMRISQECKFEMENLRELEENMKNLRNDPVNKEINKKVLARSEKDIASMNMKIAENRAKLGNIFEEMEDLEDSGHVMIPKVDTTNHHYRHPYDRPSKLGHMMTIGFTAIFGGAVLYSLSKINPENVATGAFFAGGGSQLGIMVLVASAIFFAFFLTHHKIKKK